MVPRSLVSLIIIEYALSGYLTCIFTVVNETQLELGYAIPFELE